MLQKLRADTLGVSSGSTCQEAARKLPSSFESTNLSTSLSTQPKSHVTSKDQAFKTIPFESFCYWKPLHKPWHFSSLCCLPSPFPSLPHHGRRFKLRFKTGQPRHHPRHVQMLNDCTKIADDPSIFLTSSTLTLTLG